MSAISAPSIPSVAAKLTSLEDNSEEDKNGVTQSLPPSHILEDGRFIYLPAPSVAERSRFFERSIARHGLLQADMSKESQEALQEEKSEEQEDDDDKTAPKIHPLAVASARLQANGLAELNRAINLAQLVTSGEYFGLTNIVDPSLETTGETKEGSGVVAASQQVDAVKSSFVLKRKRSQFQKASATLERHEKRLRASIQAQRVLDRRLFQLRQQWRLVAPEHGTRARLHATRPTEVVAIDVDVYNRDRVGGGNQALKANASSKQQSLVGRLANRVPRFATIELQDNFKIPSDLDNVSSHKKTSDTPTKRELSKQMETDDPDDEELSKYTRAEPFAIADPTLGRVVENFDPNKVPMLNLQLDIQKTSTGFLQAACLEPMTTLRVAKGDATEYSQDEDLLVSLQHSLFCASLFESIREELDPPPDNPTQFSVAQRSLPPVAWLSCESEQNFLPSPNRVVGGGYGLSPLSVVHCHEGEVKVQLDSEYTLCVKLIEANVETDKRSNFISISGVEGSETNEGPVSGSQSPEQLHALCRALLLHAQDVYHRNSLYLRERAKKKNEEEEARGDGPRGLARISKEDAPEKARILQSCVSLGSKMLFEQRVRKSLVHIARWLERQTSDRIDVEWIALSIFDLHSHFTLSFRDLILDVTIVRDSMTVCRVAEGGEHRKVHFHSDKAFEVFLRIELQRQLKQRSMGTE